LSEVSCTSPQPCSRAWPARVCLYLLERDQIRLIHGALAFRAEHVVRKQRHDRRHILAPRIPEHHHHPDRTGVAGQDPGRIRAAEDARADPGRRPA
jgi:hypothetical protein